ncbi:MAG: arsenical pump-driving ATPase [Planctomycetia bacterium]|nr:arsenical pump-driving ATPase [Planctomycetia bacterium]
MPDDRSLAALVPDATRAFFLTGKGGGGKTSVACATALRFADAGRRVLLVSTDPASNLDEVLGLALDGAPRAVPGAPGLFATNVDPVATAKAYREKLLAPYRGVLPAEAVASVEEQLSGACTVEVAAFEHFARLLAAPDATAGFDHVVFDTAPTGHTLRLLELPAAWTRFLDASASGASCLGPLSALTAQRGLYAAARDALADPAVTTVVLVARPDRASLAEAERAREELAALGVRRVRFVLNGVFAATDPRDPVARDHEARGRAAVATKPAALRALPRVTLPLAPWAVVGLEAVRAFADGATPAGLEAPPRAAAPVSTRSFDALVDDLARRGHGVVFTMGKGGVGKTRVARDVATALAARGHRVHLTTTDPAGRADLPPTPTLTVDRIDPRREVEAYAAEVLAAAKDLDEDGRALLEEDLRSPCTEEIAVFRALARVVAEGEDRFVVIDTAPTGHTVLLLDAALAYHRDVARTAGTAPPEVRALLPRLRDPAFASVLLVTLPEPTPVHEAVALEDDLRRAGIPVAAWVLNACLTPLAVTDPLLVARRAREARSVAEVAERCPRPVLVPYAPDDAPVLATA